MDTKYYLPNELKEIIYWYYLDIYIIKFTDVHKQLLKNDKYQISLNLTENIFDWDLDFSYALRIPKLIP